MNTTYFLNCVAGNLFMSKTSPALPAEMFIGLSKSTPQIDGTGVTEPSASAGYTRVKLTSLSEPQDGVVTNQSSITFPESTADWGTVTYFVVYDSSKVGSGNLLIYGKLAKPRTIEEATTVTISDDFLVLSIQNPA